MTQVRSDADFAEESIMPHSTRQLGVQDLDRDPSAMLKIVGQVNRGHATAPQLGVEPIPFLKGGAQLIEMLGHVWPGNRWDHSKPPHAPSIIPYMPNYWILKTEPSTYSFDHLVKEGTAVWDGVANPVALRNIRSMSPGDQIMIYHTGDEKSIVGFATVVGEPRPDPKNPKLAVVDLKAGAAIGRPVTLATIKADVAFADLALVRQGRLSVVPVPPPLWRKLMTLGSA